MDSYGSHCILFRVIETIIFVVYTLMKLGLEDLWEEREGVVHLSNSSKKNIHKLFLAVYWRKYVFNL